MRTPSHICRFYVTKSEKVLVDGVSNPEIQYHKRSEDEARSRGGGAGLEQQLSAGGVTSAVPVKPFLPRQSLPGPTEQTPGG